ncbi:uncharacterized protein LOC6561882 [Drosophila grimshawi]|uniref:GH11689 n=1 Tax=Drosophila grimshawi TaxID=7222 RepID=B4JCZ4_DROGR|nr:uncharacterized protein LOC6561882 [Drosophila grimshawi]EDW04238.1 GH11689 [Drosophila grimshawi]EDW04613.1 GH13945 [Drosophila grimshawi]
MRSTKAHCLLLIILPIGIWAESSAKKLELENQPDRLAYCRSLQRLQQYDPISCLQLLADERPMTGELLMDSQQRCWWGWELFGRRCRKRA